MNKVHIKRDGAMLALCSRDLDACTPLIVKQYQVKIIKPEYLCKKCRRKYNLSQAGKGKFK